MSCRAGEPCGTERDAECHSHMVLPSENRVGAGRQRDGFVATLVDRQAPLPASTYESRFPWAARWSGRERGGTDGLQTCVRRLHECDLSRARVQLLNGQMPTPPEGRQVGPLLGCLVGQLRQHQLRRPGPRRHRAGRRASLPDALGKVDLRLHRRVRRRGGKDEPGQHAPGAVEQRGRRGGQPGPLQLSTAATVSLSRAALRRYCSLAPTPRCVGSRARARSHRSRRDAMRWSPGRSASAAAKARRADR